MGKEALKRAVFTEPNDLAQEPNHEKSYEWGFLCSFRKYVRDFHGRQRPSSLFILLEWNAMASLPWWCHSVCMDVVRILVLRNWMLYPRLMPCSAMADIFGWLRWICWWFFLTLVWVEQLVYPMQSCPHSLGLLVSSVLGNPWPVVGF
jgi:hypothetical protein